MENKFLRESREFTRLFCLEYETDPNAARSNLIERLFGKRARIKDLTYELIENKIPGATHG